MACDRIRVKSRLPDTLIQIICWTPGCENDLLAIRVMKVFGSAKESEDKAKATGCRKNVLERWRCGVNNGGNGDMPLHELSCMHLRYCMRSFVKDLP